MSSLRLRRIEIALLTLICAAVLAGCEGRPHGMLVPTDVAALGSSRVDLLVASTRSAEGARPGEMFSGERGRGLAFADIGVSIPPDSVRQVGEVQWPSSPPGNPAKEFVTVRAERIDQPEALKRFHQRVAAGPKRRVLLFVHGYNTRFEEAVYRFAQIVHDSGAPVTPVLFTWPSRGKLLAYTYDRESANYSRDALEALLQAVVKDPTVGEVSILAHSMGNMVTLEALRQMAIRDRGIAPKIKNVMLAAPDVDVDVFRRQIATIENGRTQPDFTLFVSRDDQALAVSRRIWGSTARLGAIDPAAAPYRTALASRKFRVVDLTSVKSPDSLGHDKFAESPEVVQMIGARLASGQPIGEANSGLGDRLGQVTVGAATTIGKATSLAVSVPIAIVDGRTREGLSDQLEDVGAHASDTLGSTTKLPGER
jgi:esterase/lipase superfamily enzyme